MPQRYTRVAMGLHWVMAVVIVCNLASGLAFGALEDSTYPGVKALGGTIIGLHKALGLTVIVLTLVRIGWRLGHRPPPLPGHMTPLERGLAKITHVGFYALMLALPLSGWAMVSTGKTVRPINVFGLLDVPALPVPPAWHMVFDDSHALLGWVMLATLALHLLAVVKHEVFDRDNLLARMRPAARG